MTNVVNWVVNKVKETSLMAAGAATQKVACETIEGGGVFTDSEARLLFEQTAQRYLGMTTDDFLRTWDANAFEPELQARALRVGALIPLIRYVRAGKKAR